MPKLFGKRKKRSSVAWLTSADAYDTLCVNGYTSLDKNPEVLSGCRRLPASLQEAADAAERSAFIRAHLPEAVIRAYCGPRL